MSEATRGGIPMSSPDVDESDVLAVAEVVRSGRHALGPRTVEFEERLAAYVGASHAVAVSSGTAALHLIVRALGLGPGDEVLMPSFTFAATANAVLYEGATPVFVDIDPETYNLDPDELARKATRNTRAVMAVDVFGHPAEWAAIEEFGRSRGIPLIDDSCEALGAEYRGVRIGRFGTAAAFAFYPNKQISTGEGGIIVTDDQCLARQARSLRNQGRGEMGAWLEHERLGYNYRMDEMSAALGLSQLNRIETFLGKRQRVADWYGSRLAGYDRVRAPRVRDHVRMSWFVYVVTLAEGLEREPVMRRIERRGIPVRGYFSPLHRQPYITERFGSSDGSLPVTESIARRTIALPFHNNLGQEEVSTVVTALVEAVEAVDEA
ncbi:MAG TPA: DegT/DnrJ/EryC1/StrS family aminotransferase [Candidatus Polarisedimenticolaceae bacterium]|nr:DegT/DnrJ/EryC1/StrS family aminotransferase [Candidatus Polarisedimenticolaceae bacterium]